MTARDDAADRPRASSSGRNGWHEVTVALLGGLGVASAMFFLIAVVQTPGLDPPPESAALFLVAATASAISYHLVRMRTTAGYVAAVLTGGVVIVVVALIVAGTYGDAGPRTNPIGPLSYVALAVAVAVTAVLAWRSESGAGASSATGSVT